MAEELPYFRFNVSEWLNGDITLESERTQGLFIQICAWYWKKDCEIDFHFINKRLIKGRATLQQCYDSLVDNKIIKIDDSGLISIDFLNGQYDLLSEKRLKKVEAGRLGGLQKASNAKATLKQKSSYKDKIRKDKIRIEYNIAFDSIEFKKSFDSWIRYRKEIRHPLAPSTIESQLKKLSTYPEETAIKIIEQSIEKGWQGLFEIHDNGKNKPNPLRDET